MNPFNNHPNGKREAEIPEDVPEYRSVMMAPPPMPSATAFHSPASLDAPSLRRFDDHHQVKHQQKTAPQQSQLKAQRQAPKPLAESWNVSEVPVLPAIYILERTHVQVDCSVQEAASRICDCLRTESIAAICCDEQKVRLSIRPFMSKRYEICGSDI